MSGRRPVTFATLVETCKLGGIKPQAYLTDFLARIVPRGGIHTPKAAT